MRDRLQILFHKILNPVVRIFIAMGLSPNALTTIGLILNIAAAVIFIIGGEKGERLDLSYIGWGGAMIIFAGVFDMIDGQVARLGKTSSRFGALYDSVIDRYSELIMFLGICYYLVSQNYFFSSLIAFIALIGSVMVSYTRARAEGLGIPCKEGLMQRPERVITISLFAIICGIVGFYTGGNQKWEFNILGFNGIETIAVFTIPLAIVALLANYTAIQRLISCYNYLQEKDRKDSIIN